MLLFPKKPKFMKSFTNKKITGCFTKNKNTLRFSCLSIVAKQSGFIPNFQMESIRLLLRRLLKKRAQIFFRIFPDKPITKKPEQIRMGRGKGSLKYWAYHIKKGEIIIEVAGNNVKNLTTSIAAIKFKLSIKTTIYNKQLRWIL